MRRFLFLTLALFLVPSIVLAETMQFTPISDGVTSRDLASASQESWSTIRAGAGNTSNAVATTAGVSAIASTTLDNYRLLGRSLLFWDTTAIPDNAVISSVQVELFGATKTNASATNTPRVAIVTSTATSVNNSAYSSLGQSSLAGINYADWSTSAYNTFNLSADGLASVNKAGNTTFGFKEQNYDMSSSSPFWASGSTLWNMTWFTDNTTTSPPLLTVTYDVPPDLTTSTSFYEPYSTALGTFVFRYGRAFIWVMAGLMLIPFCAMLLTVFKTVKDWFYKTF